MRIGLFTDTYPPYINGCSTSVLMLKRALEKEGHKVYVVTTNNESSIKFNNEDKTVLRVPAIPTGIYDYRLSGIYSIKAVEIIKKWDLDVIHSHTEFGIGTFSRIVAKQLHIPLVHTYHTMYEDYTHYVTHGYFDNEAKRLMKHFTLFYCDKTATELIVPTKKAYDLFKDKYHVERSVHIVPTGLEVERFYQENIDNKALDNLRKEFKINKNDFNLLFIGRLASEKNINYVIKVVSKIVPKHKDFKFIIVGDGPDLEEEKKLVHDLGIENNVIFTGKALYDDVPTYYHLGTAFITASTSETQGLTVIEAMASSLPVICIDDEAYRNVVDDSLNGLLFSSEEDCKEKIETLMKDKELLKRMSKQARIKSENYSSNHYAEAVLDVYKYAIKEKENGKKGFFRRIIDKFKGE